MCISLKRAYDAPSKSDGRRILVERLWPRGLRKNVAKIHLWMKDAAPSSQLRRWFNHDSSKWSRFKARYYAELKAKSGTIEVLLHEVRRGKATFVFASREKRFNNAVALKEYIERRL
ncbi:MAG: DUF488 family protein [Acidobacteriota bacterium]